MCLLVIELLCWLMHRFSVSAGCDNSRLLRKKLVEEQEYAIELERMRLAELHFARKPVANHPHSSYFMDGHKFSEGL